MTVLSVVLLAGNKLPSKDYCQLYVITFYLQNNPLSGQPVEPTDRKKNNTSLD